MWFWVVLLLFLSTFFSFFRLSCFPGPISIRLNILCDHLETMHTCSTWSLDVHVVLGLSYLYHFQLFCTFSTKFL